jgi:hypothetical protein
MRNKLRAVAVAALVAVILAVPATSAEAAGGYWKRQASYAYKSWCTGAGKFWVKTGWNITSYRCIHTPDRAWQSQWSLDLYFIRN